MNAREYFNKHGYKHCKSACIQNGWLNTGFWVQLKRLVESHELVGRFGGLEMAKGVAAIDDNESYLGERFGPCDELKQAIADVESCLEVEKKLEGL